MKKLVFIEQREGQIKKASLGVLGEARRMADAHGDEVFAILFGNGLDSVVKQIRRSGAHKLLVADAAVYEQATSDALASELSRVMDENGLGAAFFAATVRGRELSALLAMEKDTCVANDCTQVERTGAELQWAIDAATSVRDDLFARGPAPDAVMARYADAGLFHIEMFLALNDKRDELLAQRRMENAYYTHLGRSTNMIFVREAGAPWDMFTLGFHPSLLAFAQAGDISAERQNEAALVAGFESVNTIGTYLRSLMLRHSDTLAGRAGNPASLGNPG